MRSTLGVLAAALTFSAPPEADVQGLYEGKLGGAPFEARLVALGKDTYKLLVRQAAPGGAVLKAELDGQAEGEAVSFKSKDGSWSAAWGSGTLKGTGPGGASLEAARVRRTPPTLGKAPPAGAIVLLDGKDFSNVTARSSEWSPGEDGSVQVPKGGMNSRMEFEGSLDLHVEFFCPLMSAARGQARANSGCYLPNGDEVQVLDSFGMDTYKGGGCGGIYGFKDPDAFDVFSLASLPPGEWQTYDIEYRVEKKDGTPSGKPRLTVYHNGIKIHDAVELKREARKGRLHFQDHGNPVRYRNIWVVPRD